MKKSLSIIALFVICLNLARPASGGSIIGEVRFINEPPKLPLVRVSKDQDYCGESLPNETYLIGSAGALKNVVVFIETGPSKAPSDPQKENILNNTGCRYSPRILAMQKGEKLKVKNDDPKLHIPHSYLEDRTVFTLSLPFKGTTIDATSRIRQAGVLKVVCDTHAWMLAYIHVFDHAYFAVSDEHGLFTIPDIPAGTYVLKAWHEDGGIRSQEITIPESGDVRAVFEFTTDDRASVMRPRFLGVILSEAKNLVFQTQGTLQSVQGKPNNPLGNATNVRPVESLHEETNFAEK